MKNSSNKTNFLSTTPTAFTILLRPSKEETSFVRREVYLDAEEIRDQLLTNGTYLENPLKEYMRENIVFYEIIFDNYSIKYNSVTKEFTDVSLDFDFSR